MQTYFDFLITKKRRWSKVKARLVFLKKCCWTNVVGDLANWIFSGDRTQKRQIWMTYCITIFHDQNFMAYSLFSLQACLSAHRCIAHVIGYQKFIEAMNFYGEMNMYRLKIHISSKQQQTQKYQQENSLTAQSELKRMETMYIKSTHICENVQSYGLVWCLKQYRKNNNAHKYRWIWCTGQIMCTKERDKWFILFTGLDTSEPTITRIGRIMTRICRP